MARYTYPDAADRFRYVPDTRGQALRSAASTYVTIYRDAGATTLADIQTLLGVAIAGSRLQVDAESRIPLFLGEVDSTAPLYAKGDDDAEVYELRTVDAEIAHASAVDPHGDRAFASGLVTTEQNSRVAADAAHVAATDPHGDRAAASSALAAHVTNTANPHAVTAAEVGAANVVVHGSVAATARPSGATVVHWYGTAAPTNAAVGDQWFDTTTAAPLVKRCTVAGTTFVPYGTGTYAPVYVAGKAALRNPQNLRRWWAALAQAMDVPAPVTVIGDSTVQGVGADNIGVSTTPDDATITSIYSSPAQLRRRFAQQFGDPGTGLIRGDDSRLVTSGSPATVGTVGVMGNARSISSSQTLTYTGTGTTVDILYWEHVSGPTSAAFTYTVDGGAPVTVAASGQSDVVKKATISGLTDASHTIVLTGTHATNLAYIGGVVFRKTYGVPVYRVGKAGYTAYQVLGKDQTSNGPKLTSWKDMTFTLLGSALNIIHVGQNDWTSQANATYGPPTPANYQANLQEMIDNSVAGGACVLLLSQQTPSPSQITANAGLTYPHTAYWDVCAALSDANDHVAHLKVSEHFSDWTTAYTLGFQINNSVHSTSKGYGEIARMLHRALTASGQYAA